jgi:hypothetical protein
MDSECVALSSGKRRGRRSLGPFGFERLYMYCRAEVFENDKHMGNRAEMSV